MEESCAKKIRRYCTLSPVRNQRRVRTGGTSTNCNRTARELFIPYQAWTGARWGGDKAPAYRHSGNSWQYGDKLGHICRYRPNQEMTDAWRQ